MAAVKGEYVVYYRDVRMWSRDEYRTRKAAEADIRKLVRPGEVWLWERIDGDWSRRHICTVKPRAVKAVQRQAD